MKHTPTKEFLDTSLSKIKLNQILSFDMNVAFKPIYGSDVQKEKKQAQASKENAAADRARQWSYAEGNVGQERNKYIILSNPIKAQQANTNLAAQNTPHITPAIEPSLPYDQAKTLNNDMINMIADFMEQNTLLWQQVAETMNAINTTSTNLQKKIEKGK